MHCLGCPTTPGGSPDAQIGPSFCCKHLTTFRFCDEDGKFTTHSEPKGTPCIRTSLRGVRPASGPSAHGLPTSAQDAYKTPLSMVALQKIQCKWISAPLTAVVATPVFIFSQLPMVASTSSVHPERQIPKSDPPSEKVNPSDSKINEVTASHGIDLPLVEGCSKQDDLPSIQ